VVLWACVALGLGAPNARAERSAATHRAGLAVLAQPPARDLAFELARHLYETPLRPPKLDEAHARVLGGGAVDASAPADLRDLASMRDAVHGDDAASRAVLDAVANDLGLRGIVLVEMTSLATQDADAGAPAPVARARVFDAETHAFDAAEYTRG